MPDPVVGLLVLLPAQGTPLDFSDFERLCKPNTLLYFNSSLHPYQQE